MCQRKSKEETDNGLMISTLVFFFLGMPLFLLGILWFIPAVTAASQFREGLVIEWSIGMSLVIAGGSLLFIAFVLLMVLVIRAKLELWKKYFNPEANFAKAKIYFLYSLGWQVIFLAPGLTFSIIYQFHFGDIWAYSFYSACAIVFLSLSAITLVISGILLFCCLRARPAGEKPSLPHTNYSNLINYD